MKTLGLIIKKLLSAELYLKLLARFLIFFKKLKIDWRLVGAAAGSALALGLLAVLLVWVASLKLGGELSFNDRAFVGEMTIPQTYDQPFLIKLADWAFSILPLGANAAQAEPSGNVVKYLNAYPETDVVQTRSFNKLKEDVILKSPGHPAEFAYQVDLSQLDFSYGANGDLQFFKKGQAADKNASPLFIIPAPFMTDANGKKSATTDVAVSLNAEGKLLLTPSAAWLKTAKYPVTLDPTVEINVLTLHSHPQQGDSWEVEFTTLGRADLKIIPNDQATIDDDEFTGLYCGSEKRRPQILSGDVIYYPDWSCDGVAKVTHYTKKAGQHALRFEYGGQVAYAYNSSAPSVSIFRAGGIPSAPAGYSYVDDVFSTYLYTGNGATQTINNGIDLAGQGGLVWAKSRTTTGYKHVLFDTARGALNYLQTANTNAQTNDGGGVTAFNADGFTENGATWIGASSNTYASWTFRKASNFFTEAQVTKSAGSDATIDLSSLGTVGMVTVKRTDSTGDWFVWHRSLTAGKLVYLNKTDAEATLGHITVSGTTLTLEDGVITDGTYIVYAWAHDTTSDGLIQCGSYTGGNKNITLGWEPQWLMVKKINDTGNWNAVDNIRGFSLNLNAALYPNSSSAEGGFVGQFVNPTATGFWTQGEGVGNSFIYCAIRRPNKPPTSGTQVYNAIARTGTGAAATTTAVGFATDLVITQRRSATATGARWEDRLRGALVELDSGSDSNDGTIEGTITTFSSMLGYSLGSDVDWNESGKTFVDWNFKRARGVFDIVEYKGTDSAHTESHNLGVAPELMIVKSRSFVGSWAVYYGDATDYLYLNNTDQTADYNTYWNDTSPTASAFTVGTSVHVNESSRRYVAYLFATKAGISKVGSYTGNGTSQTINAGFSSGARFVLIKRTDSTGDWYVWDSTRGIVAGNDPHLSLNTTAAEVTNDDSIDPANAGFIVNQVAATNINVNAATYIYLAFSGDPNNPSTSKPIVFRKGQPITFRGVGINAVCGPANGVAVYSAPSSNLCSSGIASAVSGSGPWTWTCANAASGSTASCSAPVFWTCGTNTVSDADGNSYNTVLIGSQCWMAANLNVGTRVNGASEQTNNGTVEKYCYGDSAANCTTYGGLYQWDEAMGYTEAEGARGLCPADWHIPTDAQYKTLEMSLGMSQEQADLDGWRGTTEGDEMKNTGLCEGRTPCGTSGFKALLSGYRGAGGSFGSFGSSEYSWSSSVSGAKAWSRDLSVSNATVSRSASGQAYGFSVRCLKD